MTTHPTTAIWRAILPCLYLAACMNASAAPAMPPEPTPLGAPAEEQFHQAMPKYPPHADAMRRAKIRSGLARVKQCMSKAEIRAVLGAPDYGAQAYGPKGPGEKWLGSSWTYYLSQQDEALSGIDVTVEVFFDTGDRAHWIVPSHIRNAKEIGSAAETCPRPSQ